MARPPGSRARSSSGGRSSVSIAAAVIVGIVGVALKLAFAALAIGLPLFAIWVASSMTAYHGGRVWLAALVGLAVFPGLPLLWELVHRWRRSRRADAGAPVLTGFDRFVLRSLFVGVCFTSIMLVRDSGTVFTALSTRGDWMLDGREGPIADGMRSGLVRAAQTLEWLHEATHENRFAGLVDDATTKTTSDVKPVQDRLDEVVEELTRERADAPPGKFVGRTDDWPFVAELHPAVVAMTPELETSPDAIGRHLAAVEPDPKLRVKAVHDWVADRIAYDVASYRSGVYPDQSATAVLANRRGVCAGYSQLVAAIGRAAGLEIVVVVGDVRDGPDGFAAEGHAWNAAHLGDEWVLLDATWDAGAVDGDSFHKGYSTEYLMAPPSAFGSTHFPEEQRWQLRTSPLSRAEFLRQPAVRPGFYARGLRLRHPDAPGVRVQGPLSVEIDNPLGLPLDADIALPRASTNFGWCDGDGPFVCAFNRAGSYDVRLFADRTFVGVIRVDAAL